MVVKKDNENTKKLERIETQRLKEDLYDRVKMTLADIKNDITDNENKIKDVDVLTKDYYNEMTSLCNREGYFRGFEEMRKLVEELIIAHKKNKSTIDKINDGVLKVERELKR